MIPRLPACGNKRHSFACMLGSTPGVGRPRQGSGRGGNLGATRQAARPLHVTADAIGRKDKRRDREPFDAIGLHRAQREHAAGPPAGIREPVRPGGRLRERRRCGPADEGTAGMAAPTRGSPDGAPAHDRVRQAAMNALVIEDHDDLRAVLAIMLKRLGFSVVKADNGSEGLDLARKTPPDLVLLDHHMPGSKGDEVAGKLRAAGIEAPIVMISGDEDIAHLAQRAGTALWLKKPFNMQDVVAIVQRAGLA